MLSNKGNRFFIIVPLVGSLLAGFLYGKAARLFPGGTELDPTTMGYDHLHNYWCDLLDTPSPSGHFNPGRPFARAATLVLSLSLLFFWYFTPLLWGPGIKTTVVRIAGSASALIAAFVVTTMFNYSRYHLTSIHWAGALFLTAFLGAEIALLQTKRRLLTAFGAISFSLALGHGLMWKFGLHPGLGPPVQKLALLTFFFWVGAVSLSLWRTPQVTDHIAREAHALPLIYDVVVALFALVGPFYMFGARFWFLPEGYFGWWFGFLFPWLAPLLTFLLYKGGNKLRERMQKPLYRERRKWVALVLGGIGTSFLIFMYFFFSLDLGDF